MRNQRLFKCGVSRKLVAAVKFSKEPQNFKIQPYDGYHQGKSTVPFHVLWRSELGAFVNHVEVQQQIQSSHGYDDQRKPDA